MARNVLKSTCDVWHPNVKLTHLGRNAVDWSPVLKPELGYMCFHDNIHDVLQPLTRHDDVFVASAVDGAIWSRAMAAVQIRQFVELASIASGTRISATVEREW